jgi:hypothetical protein
MVGNARAMKAVCSTKRESGPIPVPYPARRDAVFWGLCWVVAWFSLTACAVIDVSYGLRPQPSEMQSTQPILRWESFPPPRDRFAVAAQAEGRLQEVTYELRIWRADWQGRELVPGKLVYSREGLMTPSHKVETPLAWSTIYLWTVRARFLLDGHMRITEWAKQLPEYETTLDKPTKWDKRNRAVPNEFCYGFTTPAEPGRQSSWWIF